MKVQLGFDGRAFSVDTRQGVSLAIELDFHGVQPNHFGAPVATELPLSVGQFVGDTRQGGSCNVRTVSLVPHCNGTHTETVGHIVNDRVELASVSPLDFLIARLVTVTPADASACEDQYRPSLAGNEKVVSRKALEEVDGSLENVEALIIRTIPNQQLKKRATYGGDAGEPPFLTNDAMRFIDQMGCDHLLVDLPSVDKMYDEGTLSNHRIFWNVSSGSRELRPTSKPHRTITEMIFVPDSLDDGLYLLSLQVPAFRSDAAPSRPVVYPMQLVEE